MVQCETVKDAPYDYKADIWSLGKLMYITSIVKFIVSWLTGLEC